VFPAVFSSFMVDLSIDDVSYFQEDKQRSCDHVVSAVSKNTTFGLSSWSHSAISSSCSEDRIKEAPAGRSHH
ncbi:hypothetical protein XENORESO_007473, partial [Xenotaenia resolanae]